MRTFIQWSLATVVALILLTMVVGKLLATSKGRSKDASVAALKKKLGRLEAEQVRAVPAADSEAVAVSVGAVKGEFPVSIDKDALRARWLELSSELFKSRIDCGLVPPVSWRASMVFEPYSSDAALTDEQRAELAAYYACLSPAKASLLDLLAESGELSVLFEPRVLWQNLGYVYGILHCERFLETHVLLESSLDDHVAAIESLSGLLQLTEINIRTVQRTALEPAPCWNVVRKAVDGGVIEDARWDQFIELLEAHRKQILFFKQVQSESSEIVNRFENWKTIPRDLQFTEHPVSYIRTWAYPRVTPALFNHDFDRFNRAMDRLLDLAGKPYFEVKDDLNKFCEEFDVEPSIQDLKFTNGNPGWRYVLSLSRHDMKACARRQASVDVIRFAILLDRRQRATGAYPESLEVFAEALGGSIPVNPLTGDAYVYERTEDSFRLGYHDDQDPKLVAEFGLEPVKVVWWHDPLSFESEAAVE